MKILVQVIRTYSVEADGDPNNHNDCLAAVGQVKSIPVDEIERSGVLHTVVIGDVGLVQEIKTDRPIAKIDVGWIIEGKTISKSEVIKACNSWSDLSNLIGGVWVEAMLSAGVELDSFANDPVDWLNSQSQ